MRTLTPLAPSRTGQLRPRADDSAVGADSPASGRTIGVLALQGAFAEHVTALRRLGASTVEVRLPKHLVDVDALVMPGGESTTMSKLLETSGLFEAISQRLSDDTLPIFGTCAGMILLARTIEDGRRDQKSFSALNISVQRNGYGRQIDSFEGDLPVEGLQEPFSAVFIRAPKISGVGEGIRVLSTYDSVPVLVQNERHLAASFHPELTNDLRIHRLFIRLSSATTTTNTR